MTYKSRSVPQEPNSAFMQQELQNIEQGFAVFETNEIIIRKRANVPPKPRDGQLEYADGVSWNPGSGAGLYYYNGTVWVFIA